MGSLPEARTVSRVPFYRTLYFQVLVAIAIGVLVGVVAPHTGAKLKPLGDGFIKLVKMTIAPLIFCTIVVGIGSVKSMKEVGRAGGLAILYFIAASTLALILGLVVVNVIGPGDGMHIKASLIDTSSIKEYLDHKKMKGVVEFFLDIIPDTFVGAFVHGELLPVLLIAILFGFALHGIGEHGKPVLDLIERISQIVFRVIGMIMKVAPIGAFGAMAFTVAVFGIGTLRSLGLLMLCFYATCLVFIFGILGLVARLHGFSVWKLVRYIRDELFIVLGTSSSEPALPRVMTKLERLGAHKPVVGLVVPAGYSFNLDGTAIYLTMAAVFIAQATDTVFPLIDQLALLAVLLVTSKGAAGVTGSGFVVLAATLSTVGHVPVAGLAIIVGIDRFMSEARALTNVIGNSVATLVVAKWCDELDEAQLHAQLDAGPPPRADV